MSRTLSRSEWVRKRKMKKLCLSAFAIFLLIVIFILSYFFIGNLLSKGFTSEDTQTVRNVSIVDNTLSNGVKIQSKFLSPNDFSRPQDELVTITGIVIHYTGNPGTSAEANRNYFESLATSEATSASSHYVIGLEGEIIQCVPLTEIAYATKERNFDTISIECCHEDETGEFNELTYQSLISLVATLCLEFDLSNEDVIRHYDVTEKPCPLYYVEHEDAWLQMKSDIADKVKQIEKTEELEAEKLEAEELVAEELEAEEIDAEESNETN